MNNALDIVALTHDVVGYRLKAGDVGTVVHCYDVTMMAPAAKLNLLRLKAKPLHC